MTTLIIQDTEKIVAHATDKSMTAALAHATMMSAVTSIEFIIIMPGTPSPTDAADALFRLATHLLSSANKQQHNNN